jgi:U3 small nucleolar RNA-associated protein 10
VNSISDGSCHTHLIETIETLPVKNFIESIVCKVLRNCVKVSQATGNPNINHTGSWNGCFNSILNLPNNFLFFFVHTFILSISWFSVLHVLCSISYIYCFIYFPELWAKKIFSAIERQYPLELRDAIRKFLEVQDDTLSTYGTCQFLLPLFDPSFSLFSEL